MRIGLLAPSRRYEDAFLSSAELLYRASGDNLGNFAFVEALWRHLSPDVELVAWHVSPSEARARFDLLVFAAANQLGAHNELGGFASHLEKIGLPIVAVGLGAQAPDMAAAVRLPAGTERWARVLASHAPTPKPNIGVRGEFTARVLEKLGLGDRAVTTGCPSNFLNDRPDFYANLQRGFARRRIDRLAVAAGSRYFPGTREVERRLAEMVSQTSGVYIVQADLDLVRFARGELSNLDISELDAIWKFILPNHSIMDMLLWRQRHALWFADATSWMDAMRNFDFVAGARFHGVMLGIQAGVPGGVVAHDSRTLELCRTTAIPVKLAEEMPADFGLGDLHRLFAFDVAAYAATRERLRQDYLGLLRGCGIEPHRRLAGIQKLDA
jgi:hypothetical protein